MSEVKTEERKKFKKQSKKKVCTFCVDKVEYIDYKDVVFFDDEIVAQ